MGATQVGCEDISCIRAAGIPPTKTVAEPTAIRPGPPGTHPGNTQGAVGSDTRAAGIPPIKTVGCPETIANGRAGCGAGVGTGADG